MSYILSFLLIQRTLFCKGKTLVSAWLILIPNLGENLGTGLIDTKNAAKMSLVIQRVPLIVFRNENTLSIKFIILVKSAILYFW